MPAIDPRNIETPDPEVVAALRRLSGRDTLRQALAAHELGRQLVEAGIRGEHSEWSDQQVQIEIIRRMHGDAIATAAASRRNA